MPLRRLILILLFIPLIKTKAQEQNKWKELIVKIPDLNEQSVASLNKKLSTNPNLHFSGYIQSASCLILKYNPSDTSNPAAIIKTIENFNCHLPVEIVEGYTIFEIVDGKLDE